MTKKERIKYADEIERIEGLTPEHIYNMNPVNLWKLTDQFSESLVRLILTKATTNEKQLEMIRSLKADYLEACEEIANPTHSTGVRFFPPEYFSDLEYDIDCNRIITLDGSKPAPKPASLTITPVSGSIPSTQDDKNKLIAELRAKLGQTKQHVKELKAELEQTKQNVKELKDNKLDSITQEEFDEIFNDWDDNRQTKGNSQNTSLSSTDIVENLQQQLKDANKRIEELKIELQAKDEEGIEEKLDEKVLYNKVSFEFFLRLLEQAGFDINNTGNKSRAGDLWHMMTGKSADDLRRFCSSRAYKNNHTREDIKRLNEHLSYMDISIEL